jgi:putative ABC transport system permease protein
MQIEIGGAVRTIVGVFGDIRNIHLVFEPGPEIFVPFAQIPQSNMMLALRTLAHPLDYAAAVKREIRRLDAAQPLASIRSMEKIVSNTMGPYALIISLMITLALVALILASVGIYGVVSYSVSQRTREMGIRMALGARAWQVLVNVLRQGIRLVITGVILGLVAALGLARLLSAILYKVKPTDPLIFMCIPLLLLTVAILACYVPARRATRIDPMAALRYE